MQVKLLLVEEQNWCVCWLEAQNPAQSFIRIHVEKWGVWLGPSLFKGEKLITGLGPGILTKQET